MVTTRNFPKNISASERSISLTGGAALLAFGLSRRHPAGWLLAALGGALLARGLSRHCMLYQALHVNTSGSPIDHSRISVPGNRGIKVEQSLFVQRTPAELFRTWRNFENLPHFMKHLESVRVLDSKHSHWIARGPAGKKVSWDAEVINEHQNEMIAWRSLAGDVDHAGTVRFQAVPGGTDVRVAMEYDLPGGVIGAVVAKLFHEEPAQQIRSDMLRFKQMMEAAG